MPFWTKALLRALAALMGAQILVGLVLSISYQPTIARAAASAAAHDGSPLRSFHFVASAATLIVATISLVALLFGKAYRQYPVVWTSAVGLALMSFASQITGNLLPFHRHDVQTAVIEAGVASRIPGVGNSAAEALLGGPAFGQQTLSLWYLLHRVAVPIAIALLSIVLLSHFRKAKSSPGQEWSFAAVVVALVFAAAVLLGSPTGSPATASDFAKYDAMVSWYSWPMHGALRAFESLSPTLGWIGSALLPSLFAGFLMLLPLIAKRLSDRACQAIACGLAVLFLALGLISGGHIVNPLGNQDPPVQKVNPVNNTLPINESLVQAGKRLFSTNGCKNCHTLDDYQGGINLASQWKVHHDPQWYMRFIKNPQSVKPATTMPSFSRLSEGDLRALAEYLRKPR